MAIKRLITCNWKNHKKTSISYSVEEKNILRMLIVLDCSNCIYKTCQHKPHLYCVILQINQHRSSFIRRCSLIMIITVD